MPLENAAAGMPGFGRNVATEVKAGKPQKQAVAIAYSKTGEKRSDELSPLADRAGALGQRADGIQRRADEAARADAVKDAAVVRYGIPNWDGSIRAGVMTGTVTGEDYPEANEGVNVRARGDAGPTDEDPHRSTTMKGGPYSGDPKDNESAAKA
jgi:hypothetical protein